jgi:hypothetical protein
MCDTSGMLALRGRQTRVSAQDMQEKVQLMCSDEAVRERTSEDNDKNNACRKLAEMEKNGEKTRYLISHDGRASSNARSSFMHSVHLACTSRAFSSSGRIVSGVNESARLRLSPSCSSGVGGGAKRTEPVSPTRREDTRRGLLLLRSALLASTGASRCGA